MPRRAVLSRLPRSWLPSSTWPTPRRGLPRGSCGRPAASSRSSSLIQSAKSRLRTRNTSFPLRSKSMMVGHPMPPRSFGFQASSGRRSCSPPGSETIGMEDASVAGTLRCAPASQPRSRRPLRPPRAARASSFASRTSWRSSRVTSRPGARPARGRPPPVGGRARRSSDYPRLQLVRTHDRNEAGWPDPHAVAGSFDPGGGSGRGAHGVARRVLGTVRAVTGGGSS